MRAEDGRLVDDTQTYSRTVFALCFLDGLVGSALRQWLLGLDLESRDGRPGGSSCRDEPLALPRGGPGENTGEGAHGRNGGVRHGYSDGGIVVADNRNGVSNVALRNQRRIG